MFLYKPSLSFRADPGSIHAGDDTDDGSTGAGQKFCRGMAALMGQNGPAHVSESGPRWAKKSDIFSRSGTDDSQASATGGGKPARTLAKYQSGGQRSADSRALPGQTWSRYRITGRSPPGAIPGFFPHTIWGYRFAGNRDMHERHFMK